jgi:nucleotide-binding universal stress UspA family protein
VSARAGCILDNVNSTPNPIVVGYDGSPDADLALDWAARAAILTPRPLEVVIVGTHMDPVIGDFREHNERLVDEWHQRAFSRLQESGPASWDVAVRRGPTVPVLLAAAVDAELLAVGSRGHGLLLGSLSGSVSQHVARHATCPVAVVRPPRQPGSRQIAVGIDGSGGAQAALRWACLRATATGESVLAVHAYRVWSWPGRRESSVQGAAGGAEEAVELLGETTEAVRADFDEIDLTTMAVPASADRLLIDLSAVSSLVVVGSRGRDAFAEMLLGSVAQGVLHRAECPVVVVR